jgi:hypothetical protein
MPLARPTISPAGLGDNALQFLPRLHDQPVHIALAQGNPVAKLLPQLGESFGQRPEQRDKFLAAFGVDRNPLLLMNYEADAWGRKEIGRQDALIISNRENQNCQQLTIAANDGAIPKSIGRSVDSR